MHVSLRPVGPDDRALVLRLNAEHVELLAPLDDARLTALQGWGGHVDVIEVDGAPAGFVITFEPGSAYDSENYRWYAARFGTGFHYLDRVVLEPAHRGTGAAHRAYDLLEDAARPRGRLVLEVNSDPPNERSLRFHARRGFEEVGRLGGPGHEVVLLSRALAADPAVPMGAGAPPSA